MKKLFLMASFGALLAAAPALAADDHHDANPGGGTPPPAHADHAGGGGGHADHGSGGHAGAPGGGHADAHAGGTGGAPVGGHMSGPSHMVAPVGPMSGPIAPPANHGAMGDHHNHMQGAGDNHGQPGGNNMMMHDQHGAAAHNNGGHANYTALHRNFTAPKRFHAGSYHRPHGYYSHRWTYGEHLPTAFFVQSYWIDDYYDYGLMDPPPGTVWVRYGDDALLIDEYTGEVIQVEYGAFY